MLYVAEMDPGISDEEVLAAANDKNALLLTADKDFGELAFARGMPHCGILRLVNFSARLQAVVCIEVLSIKAEEVRSGAIVTAEPGRLRIRPPDSNEHDVT